MAEDIIIVGTGFSGMVAYLCLKGSAAIFGATSGIKTRFRNQGFGYNKILGIKGNSYTKLRSRLKQSYLHDRLVQGGNGTIWGGFINLDGMPAKQIELLEMAEVVCKPLTYSATGSVSVGSNIGQLQFENGQTLNPADVINEFRKGFLERFEVLADGSLKLYWAGQSDNLTEVVTPTECRKLILAVGVVQLIDLLYRSGFLNEGDAVELSEFKYELRITAKNSSAMDGAHTIRIAILRGLLHHLGIQYYPRPFAVLDRCIPLAFDQVFYPDKLTQAFRVEAGALIEVGAEKQAHFGKSIHYCNLKINNVGINQFLEKISNKIVGLGMAFVDQVTPGPISNDILDDVVRKVSVEK